MLLYSMLHLWGFDVSLADLQSFRQWDAITPGHPEVGLTPGVETTTGPLGQGVANSVGMALAARMLAARVGTGDFNVVPLSQSSRCAATATSWRASPPRRPRWRATGVCRT